MNIDNMINVKPSELRVALNVLFDSKLPAFIWGPPGIGKSEICAQVADSRSKPRKPYELRDVRLGLMDPTDIKGFPAPDLVKKQMHWLPPDFLPTSGQGLLFLDELNTAPPAVQASAYQLILNRRVGNYTLPSGWDIAAAGNNETDRAVTHRMSTALASRLIHLFLTVDAQEWCDYAESRGVSDEIIAFIKFRENLLHNFEPNAKTRTFPCPRTWFFLDQIRKQKAPQHIERKLFNGTIGEGATHEFIGFVSVLHELPQIEDVKKNPLGAKLPSSPAAVHAICTTLSRQTKNEREYEHFMKYVARLPKEFQVVYVRDCLRTIDAVQFTPTFKAWSQQNHEVLM